jgi:hypothetical protein
MNSSVYELFEQAMRERKQIVCRYHGLVREICPIVLGWSDSGEEKCLAYQFGGESTKPMTTPQTRWRCLTLTGVSDEQLRDGPWYAGIEHSQAQTCVKIVDLDVNPDSPYQPRRRLPQSTEQT